MKKRVFWLDLVFWACLCFWLLSVCSYLLETALPIRFTDWRTRNQYIEFIGFGGPIAILITKIFHYLKHRSPGKPLLHVMSGGFLMTLTILFFIIYTLFKPSEWVDEQLLYENYFSDHKIIRQSKAFEHKDRIVKVSPFTRHFEILLPVDTVGLDPHLWRPISHNQQQTSW